MPNWCENQVTLKHPNPKMVKAAIEAFEEGKFLEFAVPMPPDLRREGVETHGGENAAYYDSLRAENLEKHGYQSWYDWSVDHWGTKWDVDGEVEGVDEYEIQLRFDSAWSPPLAAYGALERQGFIVRALYCEYGMDFAGVYADGEDDCMSVREALASSIGNELDAAFDISGVLAELEEE